MNRPVLRVSSSIRNDTFVKNILFFLYALSLLFIFLAIAACGSSDSTSPSQTTLQSEIDPISFGALSNMPINSLISSNEILLKSLESPTSIRIEGGEYAINGSLFTAAQGLVSLNDKIRVRLTSSASFLTTTVATLTIGSDTFEFAVTTEDAPDKIIAKRFIFDPQTMVPTATLITSNSVIISGLDQAADISIQGGEYSINGAGYIDLPGKLNNGDSLSVRLLSSSDYLTATEATVHIGTETLSFKVTTVNGTYTWSIPTIAQALPANTVATRQLSDDLGNVWVIANVGAPNAKDNNIYALHYTMQGGFGDAFPIDDTNSTDWFLGAISDSKGNIMLTWRRATGEFYARAYSVSAHTWGDIHPLQQKSTNTNMLLLRDTVVVDDVFYLLVYERLNGGRGIFYLQQYSDQLGWAQTEKVIDANQVSYISSYDTLFYVNHGGDILVIYQSTPGFDSDLLAVVKDRKTGVWSDPMPILPTLHPKNGPFGYNSISVASDSQGFVVIATAVEDGIPQSYITFRDSDNQWLSTPIDGHSTYFQLDDKFVFISNLDDGGAQRLVSETVSRNTGVRIIQNLINLSANVCPQSTLPQVIINKTANNHVAMVGAYCGQDGIWAARYQNNGWTGIQRINQTDMVNPYVYLNLVSDQNERLFAFWRANPVVGSGYLTSASMDTSGSWSAEKRLEPSRPALDFAAGAIPLVNTDGIHVIWKKRWTEQSGTYFTSRFSTGVDWEQPYALDLPGVSALYPPSALASSLLRLPSGNMLAITYWSDGTNTSLFYSEYK